MAAAAAQCTFIQFTIVSGGGDGAARPGVIQPHWTAHAFVEAQEVPGLWVLDVVETLGGHHRLRDALVLG